MDRTQSMWTQNNIHEGEFKLRFQRYIKFGIILFFCTLYIYIYFTFFPHLFLNCQKFYPHFKVQIKAYKSCCIAACQPFWESQLSLVFKKSTEGLAPLERFWSWRFQFSMPGGWTLVFLVPLAVFSSSWTEPLAYTMLKSKMD